MKILTRYIFREIMHYFALSLVVFLGILVSIRMLKLITMVIDKGVQFYQIVQLFVSIIPTFLEVALPMSTLLGVMLAFARLSGDSEIIVIRSSGVSLAKLLRPVVLFGALMTLISFSISFYFRPWGYNSLATTLFSIASSNTTSSLDPGVFNQLGDLTIYSERVDYETGALEKVLIDDKRDLAERRVVVAKRGAIESDEKTRTITLYLKDGHIHSSSKNKYHLTAFQANSLLVDPFANGSQANQRDKRTREMYLPELSRRRKTYQKALNNEAFANDENNSLSKLTKHIAHASVEIHRKFALPFAALIMALIAMPLGIQPPRAHKTWGASVSVMLGMGVIVIYYGLLSIGTSLAQSTALPAWLGLWLPNLALAPLAYIGITKISREEWLSIATALESVVKTLPKQLTQRIFKLTRQQVERGK